MTVGQCIRYKLLEEKEKNLSAKWMDESYDLIIRLIIATYFRVHFMAEQHLSIDELDEIKNKVLSKI